MEKLDSNIEKYVGQKLDDIVDSEIRADTIAYLNNKYKTLLHYEKSGENAETVIKAVGQTTHEDLRSINHKVSTKFPNDANQVFATVMDAGREFNASMSLIIVQIRADRASTQ